MVSVPALVLGLDELGFYELLLSVRPSRLNALVGLMSDMETYIPIASYTWAYTTITNSCCLNSITRCKCLRRIQIWCSTESTTCGI